MRAIDRREALRRVAILLGGAVSAPTWTAVLAGCDGRSSGTAAAWTPRTLTQGQLDLVDSLSEIILPETETAGARSARVREFVDAMLTDYYPAEDRERFLAGLARVEQRAQRTYGRAWADLTAEEQTAIVAELDRLAYLPDDARPGATVEQQDATVREGDVAAGRAGETPASASGAIVPDTTAIDAGDRGEDSFFRTMKELTLVGYYTSEVGATTELRVNPMGEYLADIPYDQVGTAWA